MLQGKHALAALRYWVSVMGNLYFDPKGIVLVQIMIVFLFITTSYFINDRICSVRLGKYFCSGGGGRGWSWGT